MQQAFCGLLSTQPKTRRVFWDSCGRLKWDSTPTERTRQNPHVSTLAHNLIKTTIAALLLPWSFCCLAHWKCWNLFVVCWSQDLLRIGYNLFGKGNIRVKMYVPVENWMMSVMLKHPRRGASGRSNEKVLGTPNDFLPAEFSLRLSKLFVGRFTIVELQAGKIFQDKNRDGKGWFGIPWDFFAQWDFCWKESQKLSRSINGVWGGFDVNWMIIYYLGGGFKYFLFPPLPEEMIQFD